MKVGQLIGAGAPGKFGYQGGSPRVGLYCEITSIDDQGIHAWVINGHWNLSFTKKGTVMYAPTGNEYINAQIVYTGYIPAEFRNDYEDALAWMNGAVNSRVPMWAQSAMFTIRHAVLVRVTRLCNVWQAAISAGRKEWNRKSGSRKIDEFCDEIPF